MKDPTEGRLLFRMSGNQFDNGKNLRYLIIGLDNFHRILDKSYLTLSQKIKMSDRDREVFEVKALNIKDGSFEAEIGVYLYSAAQLALPMIMSLSVPNIIDIAAQGYRYLKFVLSANTEGKTVELTTGSDSVVVQVQGDNNKIVFPLEAWRFVRTAEPHFEALAKAINISKGVDAIEFFDQDKPEDRKVRIDKDSKDLFKGKIKLERVPTELKGTIFRADGKDFVGKLNVTYSEDAMVKVGSEYNFDFINKCEVEKLSDSFMKERTVYALKETVFDSTTLETRVLRLRIIDIE